MDPIYGTLNLGDSIAMDIAIDPNLEIGKVYWIEQKEATLLRPEIRARFEVVGKTTYLASGVVEYKLRHVTPPPEWSERIDDAPTISI